MFVFVVLWGVASVVAVVRCQIKDVAWSDAARIVKVVVFWRSIHKRHIVNPRIHEVVRHLVSQLVLIQDIRSRG